MGVGDWVPPEQGTTSQGAPQPSRWKNKRLAAIAAVIVLVILVGVGGFAVAHTVTSGTTPTPAASNTPPSTAPSATPGNAAPNSPSGRGGAGTIEAGTVRSVSKSANSFTVTSRTGSSVTIDVTSSTTYHDTSIKSPTFADVTVGKMVFANGTTGSDGVFVATQVTVGTRGGGFPGGRGTGGGGFFGGGTRPAAFGTVQSVDASAHSFVVTSQTGGSVTVLTSSATTYSELGGKSASFSTIKVNARVAVTGSTTTSGTVQATSVALIPSSFGGGGGRGTGGFGAAPGSNGGAVG